MKKSILILLILIGAFGGGAEAQTKIKGTIRDKDNAPLVGATVTNKQTKKATQTDANGRFEIEASVNDVLTIGFVGYSTSEVTVSDDKAILDIRLLNTGADLESQVVAFTSLSPKSYWLGATIGYNIDGADVDNVVGSAKVGINPIKGQYLKAEWGIVGNFANFISAQDKDKMDKNLTKLAQSAQGLSIAVAGTWELLPKGNDFNMRCFFTTGYRFNAYQKVGKDSVTVGISQFHNTAGLEMEGLEFKNGGKLHFSAELGLSVFSQKKYELVFSEKKSSLLSLAVTAILPIAANIGFIAGGTYAKGMIPVYQFGIVFKDRK